MTQIYIKPESGRRLAASFRHAADSFHKILVNLNNEVDFFVSDGWTDAQSILFKQEFEMWSRQMGASINQLEEYNVNLQRLIAKMEQYYSRS